MISILPVFVVCQIMRLTLIWSATKSLALYVFFYNKDVKLNTQTFMVIKIYTTYLAR